MTLHLLLFGSEWIRRRATHVNEILTRMAIHRLQTILVFSLCCFSAQLSFLPYLYISNYDQKGYNATSIIMFSPLKYFVKNANLLSKSSI